MLRQAGIITDRQLRDALGLQKKKGSKIGSALVEIGAIDEDVLATFLGMQRGIDAVPLTDRAIPRDVIGLISKATAYRFGAVPVSRKGKTLTVVLVDPSDDQVVFELERETGLKISAAIAPQMSIYSALKRFYGDDSQAGSLVPPSAPGLDRFRRKLAEARRILEEIERELAG